MRPEHSFPDSLLARLLEDPRHFWEVLEADLAGAAGGAPPIAPRTQRPAGEPTPLSPLEERLAASISEALVAEMKKTLAVRRAPNHSGQVGDRDAADPQHARDADPTDRGENSPQEDA